jgi:acetoin utilization protein AcuB
MTIKNVKEIMTRSLVSVRWSYSLKKAEELMEEYRIRHLPVMDDEGSIVGILSDRDVKRGLNPNRPGFSPTDVVGAHMSWPALTVSEDTPIVHVVEGMIDEKISAFLVMRDKNCVGIVTSEDLLRYLATLLRKEDQDLSLAEVDYEPLIRSVANSLISTGI